MAALRLGKRKDVDMTHGSIIRHLISFSVPLLIGNIFQQLYNMVDTWVVGNFVSNEAFSAVGTVGPIMNLLIGFFMGLATGAGTVISQYYGAKQEDKVNKTVHTAILLTLIMGIVFTAVGISITPLMLKLMKTPDNVLPEATQYLTLYFSGIMGLMFYNMGSGVLRAVGDSQRPFYYLVVAAVLNTILDLVFVIYFDMGVAGVALATITAQFVSAILVIIALFRNTGCVKLSLKKLRFTWSLLSKICRVGIPAALQMTITSFSNVFVQSYINQFGHHFMAGWTAYNKIDQVMFLPMQSLALASTTFVGQNLGANQPERARKGVLRAIALSMSCTAILMIPVIAFAPALVAFFNSTPEVINFGTMLIRWLSPFYVLCCVNQICGGALRGAGNSLAPMLILLGSFVVFRQAYLFIVSRICNEVLPIALSYPAGWLVCSTIMLIYYSKVKLTKTRLVDDESK